VTLHRALHMALKFSILHSSLVKLHSRTEHVLRCARLGTRMLSILVTNPVSGHFVRLPIQRLDEIRMPGYGFMRTSVISIAMDGHALDREHCGCDLPNCLSIGISQAELKRLHASTYLNVQMMNGVMYFGGEAPERRPFGASFNIVSRNWI
jgi:hypothetical protein